MKKISFFLSLGAAFCGLLATAGMGYAEGVTVPPPPSAISGQWISINQAPAVKDLGVVVALPDASVVNPATAPQVSTYFGVSLQSVSPPPVPPEVLLRNVPAGSIDQLKEIKVPGVIGPTVNLNHMPTASFNMHSWAPSTSWNASIQGAGLVHPPEFAGTASGAVSQGLPTFSGTGAGSGAGAISPKPQP